MNTLLYIMISLVAIKALIGFHFSWEKCKCCRRRWKDHVRTRGIIEEITNEYGADEEDVIVYVNTGSRGVTGMPEDRCLDFDPKVGDFVEIDELDLTMRKI